MIYTIIIYANHECIEVTDIYADTDAEAMEYAMNQACFHDATEYDLHVYSNEFVAHISGTHGSRLSYNSDSM